MRNPDRRDHWIPAFAGMTTHSFNLDRLPSLLELRSPVGESSMAKVTVFGGYTALERSR